MRARLFAGFLFIIVFSVAAMAQTTEFVYQGQLQNASAPANGNFDFEFLLFDQLSAGAQVGSTLTRSGVIVTNGIFSVKLDFGSVYPGANRFLEIHVQQQMGGGFTPLTPRQSVSSVPYAVKSISAVSADTVNAGNISGVLSATQGGTGVGPAPPPFGTFLRSNGMGWQADGFFASDVPSGSPYYIQNSTNQQASGNFNISGDGTAGGTLFGQNVNASFEYRLGGQRFLSAVSSNSAFGLETGAPNLGLANTYVGYRSGTAGTSNTSNNSFFGANAGRSNSNGNNNAFFGVGSGEFNTFGGFNTFFGTTSGAANINGNRNTFIGVTAGRDNTQGDDNTFVGGAAGQGNMSGASNSFFGSVAGVSTTAGSSNAFFGDHAGQSNTLGSFNSAFGSGANIGGGNLSFATALGAGAIVSASNTLVLGRAADTVQVPGNLNVTGTFTGNIPVGSLPAGSTNYIQNGTSAQASSNFNVSGNGTAGGTLSGNSINAASQYTIGGNRVLSIGGSDNIFAGVSAGASCTGCSSSSFFGKFAGNSSVNGPNNSFFGYQAGVGSTNGANTFFGSLAGSSNTTGTSNTAIGFTADVGSGGLNNATAIGYGAIVSTSGSLVLGNGAKVGIGTSSPTAKLHVAGGNVYIANPNSLIITSPNGACWFITVSNTGALSTISVTCP